MQTTIRANNAEKELAAVRASLDSDLGSLRAAADTLEKSLAKSEARVAELESQVAGLQKQLVEQGTLRERLSMERDEAKERVRGLTGELAQARQQQKQLETQVAELTKQLQALRATESALRAECRQRDEQVVSACAERDRLADELAQCRAAAEQDGRSAGDRAASLQERVAELDSERAELRTRIASLEREVQVYRTHAEERAASISSLQRSLDQSQVCVAGLLLLQLLFLLLIFAPCRAHWPAPTRAAPACSRAPRSWRPRCSR